MGIKLPKLKLPEKSAETWQLKKLELAMKLCEQNEEIIHRLDRIIELLAKFDE